MLERIPLGATVMIDLHGKSVQESKKLLAEQFALIEEKQVREFYIITGRGNHRNANGTRGVLKKILPKLLKPYGEKILEIDPEAGSYKIILKPITQRPSLKDIFSCFDQGMLELLTKEVEPQDSHALIFLALIHLAKATGTQKGIELLERARRLDSLEAYILLGDLYLKNQNYPVAIKYLKYAAERNDSLGQLRLAGCYLLGQGVKQNDQQAFYWMSKSAQQGEAYAQSNLGRSYYNGEFTGQNIELAIKYLNLAVEQGVSESMCYLARCYAAGDGIEQDNKKAFDLYRRAAELKEVYALHLVGQFYLDGRSGFPPSEEKALPWLIEAANLGDADSQARLASIYLLGKEKRLEQGYTWLEKALSSQHRFAYYILGHAYQEGIGKYPQNYLKAYEFIKLAAEANYPAAQYELAVMLLLGENPAVLQDDASGLHWLKEAAKRRCLSATQAFQEDSSLEHIRSNLRQQITAASQTGRIMDFDSLLEAAKKGNILAQAIVLDHPMLSVSERKSIYEHFWQQKNQAVLTIMKDDTKFIIIDSYLDCENLKAKQVNKILCLLNTLAEQQKPEAYLRLGAIYHEGLICKKNTNKSMQYWQQGANLNDADCLCSLGYYYEEKAKINPRAYEQAFIYHTKAAQQGSANSSNQLGLLYKTGQGVTKNIPRAIECFHQAMCLEEADKNAKPNHLRTRNPIYPYAAFNLGVLYAVNHENFPKDEEKSLFWIRKAAALGHESAIKVLARMGLSVKSSQINSPSPPNEVQEEVELANLSLEDKKVVNSEELQKHQHLIRAATAGHLVAQALLLTGLPKALLSPAEYKNIVNLFWQQADEKILTVPDDMKFLVIDAYSMNQDLTEAQQKKVIRLLNILAEKQYPQAFVRLAFRYKDDIEKFLHYCRLGEKLQDAASLHCLGCYYEEKAWTDSSAIVKTFEYYSKAAAAGSEDSCYRLGLLYQAGNGVQKDIVRAADYFQRVLFLESEENKDRKPNGLVNTPVSPDAAYELAMLYWQGGENFPVNKKKALSLLIESAASGHTIAQKRMTQLEVPNIEKPYGETNKVNFWKAANQHNSDNRESEEMNESIKTDESRFEVAP